MPYHLIPKIYIMNVHSLVLLTISLLFSSCVLTIHTDSNFQDEIYYSSTEYEKVKKQDDDQNNYSYDEDDNQQENYSDEYNFDDHYDYGYSARLRRFHGPSFSFGYYNNFYTNSFWYSRNPFDFGMSIYYGYNFWDPFYYPSFYGSHYHFLGHHHMYAYHPFYHNIYAYNYPTYYNSFDNNSIYYGPRESSKLKTPESFVNRYQTEKPTYLSSKPAKDIKQQYVGSKLNANKPVKASSSKRPFNQSNLNFNKTPSTRPDKKPSKLNQHIQIESNYKKPSYSKRPSKNEDFKQKKPSYRAPSKPSPTFKSPSPSKSFRPSSSGGRRPR